MRHNFHEKKNDKTFVFNNTMRFLISINISYNNICGVVIEVRTKGFQ